MVLAYSMIRRVAPKTIRAAFSSSSYMDHLTALRLLHSKEPQPFTSGLPLVPIDVEGTGHEHKKVTVVGCGQVGMAIAVSVSLCEMVVSDALVYLPHIFFSMQC